jgi:hypothetical protein
MENECWEPPTPAGKAMRREEQRVVFAIYIADIMGTATDMVRDSSLAEEDYHKVWKHRGEIAAEIKMYYHGTCEEVIENCIKTVLKEKGVMLDEDGQQ